jgi:hypothetical protein
MEDWGRLISFHPGLVLAPASVDELKGMLEQVHRENGRIRVLGSMHSCAKIVVSDTVLDMSALPTSIDFDPDHGAVVATANVTLHELLAAAGEFGKSLTATGGTDAQTLAGLISTNTAPASSLHSIYDLLDWVELITLDAAGKAVTQQISFGDPEFPAAVCSLGALGVLTRVRFRLVNEPYFKVQQRVVPLTEVLSDLDATSAQHAFWRIDWLPKTEKGLLWTATVTPLEESIPDGDYPADRAERVLDIFADALDKLSETGPLLNRPLELVYHVLSIVYGKPSATGPLRNMLPVDRDAPLHVAMAEWGFAPKDLSRVRTQCEEYFGANGWPNLPIEIELTQVDQNLMSPWNWPALPYVVKFNFMYLTEVCTEPGEKRAIYTHLKGLWDHLIAAGLHFKAHWGKINFIDPEFLLSNGVALEAFRNRISPIFMNDYLTERLGPIPTNPVSPE